MDDAQTPDADEALLARFATLDADLGERMHARAMAAETAEEAERFERAFHRCARSLRQTLALKARLREASARAARKAPPPPAPRDPRRVKRRVDAIRAGVRRVIFTEREGEAADYLCDLLEERLEIRRTSSCLEIASLDDEIINLCDDFGLDADVAEGWRDLPDPAREPDPDPDLEDGDPQDDDVLEGEWESSG